MAKAAPQQSVLKKAAPAKNATTTTTAAAAPTSVPTVKATAPVPTLASTPAATAQAPAPILTSTTLIPASVAVPAAALTNGTAEKHVPTSVITAKPKNGEAIAHKEPAKIPATFIHTNNTSTEEPNAKKSGIRIKYSGINNGAKHRIAEQNQQNGKPNLVKELPRAPTSQQVPVIASTPIANHKAECKENNKPVPAVTPKASKELDTSFEENVKFADIDDIELPDGTKITFTPDITAAASEPNLSMDSTNVTDISMTSNELNNTVPLKTRKVIIGKRSILRKKHKFNLKGDSSVFACRHCGKRYRWKSTLRRHENDECGNKEPAHKCPYCPYKAKQRGNLGVHVRKHHADKPELESKRKRRTM